MTVYIRLNSWRP